MKFNSILLMSFLITGSMATAQIKYPITKTVNVTDEYFGTSVSDPYRWLEDDRSEATAEWVKAQNEVTNAYLAKIPFRKKLKERLTTLYRYGRSSAPFKRNGKYYFFSNDGS